MAGEIEAAAGEEGPSMLDSGDPNGIPGAQLQTPDERTVNYVFPVEVIVVGALTDDDHREIYRRVWNDFGEALAYQDT